MVASYSRALHHRSSPSAGLATALAETGRFNAYLSSVVAWAAVQRLDLPALRRSRGRAERAAAVPGATTAPGRPEAGRRPRVTAAANRPGITERDGGRRVD